MADWAKYKEELELGNAAKQDRQERHPFSELRAKMSPEAQERATAKAKILDGEIEGQVTKGERMPLLEAREKLPVLLKHEQPNGLVQEKEMEIPSEEE